MVQSQPILNQQTSPLWVVGSLNPVKINAVKLALSSHWPEARVVGYETDSGVPAQPLSDAQTKKGAINRAKFALKQGLIEHDTSLSFMSVGLEGGVMKIGSQLWTTIWVCVMDEIGHLFLANGGRFLVPVFLAKQLLQGAEMGPAIARYFQGRSVKTQEGLVGIITKRYLDRTDLYQSIVKLAVGQWFGQDWWQAIPELATQMNGA